MKVLRQRLIAFSIENRKPPTEVHIVPIGEWKERGFRIVEADCADIIRNFENSGIDLVIDYEHQTLNTDWNGAPAPAAGWISKLELRENGIWATEITWTEEAKRYIEELKYRYISPVLDFNDHDRHDDGWIGASLHSVALTNTPYFKDDLEAFRKENAAPKTDSAEKTKEKEQMDELKQEIAALKQKNEAHEAKIQELEGTVAAKDAELAALTITRKVDDMIAAKQLAPAQRDTAIFMAEQGEAVLEKFVAATAMADLTQPVDIQETKEDAEPEDPKGEFKTLMQDPAKMIKFKKENPERFKKLYEAYIGGK